MREPLRLKIIDGLTLDARRRELLRPGEPVRDGSGHTHFLPRFFYQVESWQHAKETRLSAHFTLAELMSVDCKEADLLLRELPHYVPCAVSVLAHFLEAFREKVSAPVFISTNGGYRSPAHRENHHASPHQWAAAANIYRVGDTYLSSQGEIDKYARIAVALAPEIFTKPYGHGRDETDDHLHIDVGYLTCVPRECDEAQ
jgi:hypothetical protein